MNLAKWRKKGFPLKTLATYPVTWLWIPVSKTWCTIFHFLPFPLAGTCPKNTTKCLYMYKYQYIVTMFGMTVFNEMFLWMLQPLLLPWRMAWRWTTLWLRHQWSPCRLHRRIPGRAKHVRVSIPSSLRSFRLLMTRSRGHHALLGKI